MAAPWSPGSRMTPQPTRVTRTPEAKGTDAQQYFAQGCSGNSGQKHMNARPMPEKIAHTCLESSKIQMEKRCCN